MKTAVLRENEIPRRRSGKKHHQKIQATPETIKSGEEWGGEKKNRNRRKNNKKGCIPVECFKEQQD